MEEGSSKRWYYASLSLILILVIITSSLLALYFDLRLHNATLEKELENLEVQNSRLETKFETLQANLESELNIMRSMLGNMTPQYANESIALIGAKIYKIAEPSVVLITLEVLGGGVAQGSGFVYNVEGYIVTNNHVVEDAVDPNSLTVMFMNGTVTKAFVVGRDPYSDLAVIKVDLPSEMLKPLPIGNSSALRVGEPVFAVGNPFGLSGTITSGIVDCPMASAPINDKNLYSARVSKLGPDNPAYTPSLTNISLFRATSFANDKSLLLYASCISGNLGPNASSLDPLNGLSPMRFI